MVYTVVVVVVAVVVAVAVLGGGGGGGGGGDTGGEEYLQTTFPGIPLLSRTSAICRTLPKRWYLGSVNPMMPATTGPEWSAILMSTLRVESCNSVVFSCKHHQSKHHQSKHHQSKHHQSKHYQSKHQNIIRASIIRATTYTHIQQTSSITNIIHTQQHHQHHTHTAASPTSNTHTHSPQNGHSATSAAAILVP
jgi:hypothetical protein